MAQKKKSSRKKAPAKKSQAPKHSLPSGFWLQVGAVCLIAISVLFVAAWLGAGGPVLEWVNTAALNTIGYGVYVIPFLFVYLAVATFRAEENRIPFVVKVAGFMTVVWFAGIFGLMQTSTGDGAGGFVGTTVNSAMSALVEASWVAALIYTLLIVITVLFVVQVTPMALFRKIADMVRTDRSEQEANVKVMRKAAAEDAPKPSGEIKLNAGVPILDHKQEEKKKRAKTGLKTDEPRDKVAESGAALVVATDPNWKAPDVEFLEKKQNPADAGDVQQNAQIIKDTLSEFNIEVEMEGANVGPKVTQYTLRPPSGVKLTRITQLETNIALNLAAQSLRIEAPIPGQKAVGIEVPNRRAADVRLYGIMNSKQWKSTREPLPFAIGKDISGEAVIGELNKMPHLLVAGQTGSGKSVMINTLLTSLLYRNSPSELKLILVDPKQVEMAPYEDIPHLLTPIITEPEKTVSALKWAVNEMERRYKQMAELKIKNIKDYNARIKSGGHKIAVEDEDGNMQQHEDGAMPYIVIVIDEMADLMMVAKRDVEALIVRIAQKARAVGIHLVLATQRPSVDVITGLIKANVPARIAFTVASQIDSMTILDQAGAEKLLGQGDMLLKTVSMPKPKRIQGAWVTDEEVAKITDHLRMQSAPQYNDEIISQPVQLNGKGGIVMGDFDGGSSDDDMYQQAVQAVVEGRKASTSYLQRRLRIGYSRAARIIEEMEEQGIIGPADGSRPREVLITSLDDLGGSSDIDV